MEAIWQVQEAKNRFSEVIDRALSEGPQIVTRHGRVVVRVVAAGTAGVDAAPTQQNADGFLQYLLAAPRVDAGCDGAGDGLLPPPRRSRKSVVVLGG